MQIFQHLLMFRRVYVRVVFSLQSFSLFMLTSSCNTISARNCCHLGSHSVCALGYADDIALLAPSPSAMRILLKECEVFASEFDITFNASKTQLICFSNRQRSLPNGVFRFNWRCSLFYRHSDPPWPHPSLQVG